ncbi:MAG TPA: DegT/DnrJ/EryC1/StrS family aminotransferase, partial [Holophaga sp.]|nr:DegT/DnrJ/EryC1/StrS family aminotransferase [Holophaga sp.]
VVYYPVPCHRLPVYREAYAGVACPQSEAACAEVLSLPLWPGMDEALVDRVAGDLADLLGGRRP